MRQQLHWSLLPVTVCATQWRLTWLMIGIALLALAYSPVGGVPFRYGVNQTAMVEFACAGLTALLLAPTFSWPPLVIIHLACALMVGTVPTIYYALTGVTVLIVGGMALVFGSLRGTMDTTWLQYVFTILGYWLAASSITVGYWICIMSGIRRRYRPAAGPNGDRHFYVSAVLLTAVGWLGGHRFFLGHWRSGVLFIATFGVLGVGVLVDAVLLCLGILREGKQKRAAKGALFSQGHRR